MSSAIANSTWFSGWNDVGTLCWCMLGTLHNGSDLAFMYFSTTAVWWGLWFSSLLRPIDQVLGYLAVLKIKQHMGHDHSSPHCTCSSGSTDVFYPIRQEELLIDLEWFGVVWHSPSLYLWAECGSLSEVLAYGAALSKMCLLLLQRDVGICFHQFGFLAL